MSDYKKALTFGFGFVVGYFLLAVMVFRVLFSAGFDANGLSFLQWPIAFPHFILPDEFWIFVNGSMSGQKSLFVTAAYLVMDVLVYSVIAFAVLRVRRSKILDRSRNS